MPRWAIGLLLIGLLLLLVFAPADTAAVVKAIIGGVATFIKELA